ncbi:MAG: hypothetical protein ACLFM7_00255 [Bacteroidales bacterium]
MNHANYHKELRYLRNHEINFIKWDDCINNAHNGSLYAFSWYLDFICEEWEGIVLDDYLAVMPLLTRKISGVKYVYTSRLANQLGVFSTEIMDKNMVNTFLDKVNRTFKIFEINLNKFNTIDSSVLRQKNNNTYEFDLITNYDIIRSAYSQALLDGIDHANRNHLHIFRGVTPSEFMEFINDKLVVVSIKQKKGTIYRLHRIADFMINHELGDIYGAYSPLNKLCAAVFFLKSKRQASMLFSGISQEGFRLKAMELLVDLFIRDNAEKNITLNFENLAIPNKEKFFTGFGAKNFHFTTVKNTRNPFLFRRLRLNNLSGFLEKFPNNKRYL